MPLAGEVGPARVLLVLGSASPARARLLRDAGIAPVIHTSRVDEEALIAATDGPAEDGLGHHAPARDARVEDAPVDEARALTQMLATAKARDVAAQVRAGDVPTVPAGSVDRVLVLGADSMLAFGGRILGKASTGQAVRERWAAMAGRSGVLVTGHSVIDVDGGRMVERTVATTIRFGRPDAVELESYIASGEPLAVAGSCTIDGLGGPFIDGVDGDHTNVIGLALPTLRAMVGELGVRWTGLWSTT